jgi:protein TonB
MLSKKSSKARLSPYRKIFFQLGLVLTLLLIYIVLEWKTVERSISELDQVSFDTEEMMDIPTTQRVLEIKPPPPPPPAPEKIEIVTNDADIIETVLESTETDESEFVEVTEYEDIVEIIEDEEIKDVPFAIIEEAPIYPGCKGNKQVLKECLQEKINKHVLKYFNSEIAQELGLKAGKKKVYVQFKIDKTGEIVNIRARGPHSRLEKEAIRVVKLLPKMTPGKQRTRPVGVSYTLPITLVVIQ